MFTFHIHTAQNATRGIFVLLYFQPFFDIIVSYRTVATVREYVYVRTYCIIRGTWCYSTVTFYSRAHLLSDLSYIYDLIKYNKILLPKSVFEMFPDRGQWIGLKCGMVDDH